MDSDGTRHKGRMPDPRSTSHKRQAGQRAEAIAAAALERAGYTILDRNWRCSGGEIDLVAQQQGQIVIVEVRARAGGDDINAALESITKPKQARLIRLAYAYLEQHHLDDVPFRIDVVAVSLSSSPPAVEIIENAVGW